MIGGPFVLYSEITGIVPTEEDVASLLRPLDVRKVLFLLSRMNMHLRLASMAADVRAEQAIGKAQEFLFVNFIDEQLFAQVKCILGNAKTHERLLFHPVQLLNLVRCAVKYCEGTDTTETITDDLRYLVGRCCVMMNDLLTTKEENQRLSKGSDGIKKAELMTQLLPGFEVSNPGNLGNLIHRSLGTFNLILSDAATKAEVLNRSGGYDFVQRFNDLIGLPLERWIAILFSCIAYLMQYGGKSGSDQNYNYLWIDPKSFVGESKISVNDLSVVLSIVSNDIDELKISFGSFPDIRQSFNITPLKSRPLVKLKDSFICSDFGFLVEKLFAGAYWAVHDREALLSQLAKNPIRPC